MQVTVQVLVGYRVQDPQSIVQLPRGQLWTPNFTQILEVGLLQCFSMIQVMEKARGKEKERQRQLWIQNLLKYIRIWPS